MASTPSNEAPARTPRPRPRSAPGTRRCRGRPPRRRARRGSAACLRRRSRPCRRSAPRSRPAPLLRLSPPACRARRRLPGSGRGPALRSRTARGSSVGQVRAGSSGSTSRRSQNRTTSARRSSWPNSSHRGERVPLTGSGPSSRSGPEPRRAPSPRHSPQAPWALLKEKREGVTALKGRPQSEQEGRTEKRSGSLPGSNRPTRPSPASTAASSEPRRRSMVSGLTTILSTTMSTASPDAIAAASTCGSISSRRGVSPRSRSRVYPVVSTACSGSSSP